MLELNSSIDRAGAKKYCFLQSTKMEANSTDNEPNQYVWCAIEQISDSYERHYAILILNSRLVTCTVQHLLRRLIISTFFLLQNGVWKRHHAINLFRLNSNVCVWQHRNRQYQNHWVWVCSMVMLFDSHYLP